jgi:hypothetical protein
VGGAQGAAAGANWRATARRLLCKIEGKI